MLGFSETYVYISLNQIYFFYLGPVSQQSHHSTLCNQNQSLLKMDRALLVMKKLCTAARADHLDDVAFFKQHPFWICLFLISIPGYSSDLSSLALYGAIQEAISFTKT